MVNKPYNSWLRDRFCTPTRSPQDIASYYWYFSVLCVSIYGFTCVITAGEFSLFCMLVPFRSWPFRRVCFRGYLLIGFLFVRCIFTDIRISYSRCKKECKLDYTECRCIFVGWITFTVKHSLQGLFTLYYDISKLKLQTTRNKEERAPFWKI